MQKAMECVNKKEMTMRGAAKKYKVPYSTLKDRIRERVKHGTRPGVKTMLNLDEELRLVRVINVSIKYLFENSICSYFSWDRNEITLYINQPILNQCHLLLQYMEDCGFNVQRKDIRSKAHEILILKNGNTSSSSMPGHNWLTGFLERHNGIYFILN